MPKILLVEDDNNLREIYEARFKAEGYEIVSAHDGEEALVVAKSEKPDLVISDVMMPKISGFEMLDILRNTDSLKNVRVIMLTALGQSDDQQRASKLGADKYLVKSQVTLEDIVNVANELLNPGKQADVTMPTMPNAPSATPAAPATTPPPTTQTVPMPYIAVPIASTAAPAPAAAPATTPPPMPAPTPEPSSPPAMPIVTALNATDPDGPTAQSGQVPGPQDAVPAPAAAMPTNQPLATEQNTEASPIPADESIDLKLAEPEKQEENSVKSQIDNFMNNTNPGAAAPQAVSAAQSQIPISQDKPPTTEEKQSDYSPNPTGKKLIEPLPDEEKKPDINELLDKEQAMEIVTASGDQPAGEPNPTAAGFTPEEQASPSQTTANSDPNTFDSSNIAL